MTKIPNAVEVSTKKILSCPDCGGQIQAQRSISRCRRCAELVPYRERKYPGRGKGIPRPGAGKRPTLKSLNRREYNSWKEMIRRCYQINCNKYSAYGGKGIKVCERWRNSFEAFFEDMGPRPDGTSLDRFPNKLGDYEARNCRWADMKQQNRNKINNRMITFRGESKPLAEWAELCSISRFLVRDRLESGWTVEKALTTRANRKKT